MQVVGSFDIHATKYFTALSPQPSGQTIVADMETMCCECLKNFKEKTGSICRRIVVYRSDVGEGSRNRLLNVELMAMKRAWRSLYPDEAEEVKITLIVVIMHHHVRIYPQGRTADRSGNVPTGTLVDGDITNAHDTDFFLVSQPGLRGTSRPTHYNVLYEDNGLTLARIEIMTFDLCHVYSRASRAISQPAPSFYAHLAAFRCRYYVHQGDDGNFRVAPLNDRLRSVMFYG